jgi:uncharacterized membrane protein
MMGGSFGIWQIIIALLFLSYIVLNIVFLIIVSVSSVKISKRLDELVKQNENRLNNKE